MPDQLSKSSKSKASGNLEQFAKQAARQPQQPAEAAADDDQEFEFDGEKYKKSQLADLAKKRREYDRAASQRMEEAAKLRKEVAAERAEMQAALQQFKQDPWALFQHAGLNPDEAAELRLTSQLKRQQMSPEALELERANAELQQLRQQQQQAQEAAKQQAHEQRVQHWLQYFDKAIGSALESGSIPRTAHTGQRVRQAMEDLVDAGHQLDDTTAALAVDIARDRMLTETQQLLGGLASQSPKMLVELLGGLDSEIVKAVQRLAVERHEASARPKPVKTQQVAAPKPKTQGPPTFEDVRKQLGIA